jgi:hypothetical protein
MSDKRSFIAFAAVAGLAVLAAVGLAACGGTPLSTTAPSAVVASSDDAAPMVIFSNVFDEVEMGEQRITDISLPRDGTLMVTLRWNDQNNYVSALLSPAGCSRVSDHGPACQVRNSVERQGKEGREGHIEVPGARGGYRLLVENEGPSRESIRVTVELINSPRLTSER